MKKTINLTLLLVAVFIFSLSGAHAEDTIEFSGKCVDENGNRLGRVRLFIRKYRQDPVSGKQVVEKENSPGEEVFYGYSKWDYVTFRFVKPGHQSVTYELSAIDKNYESRMMDVNIVLRKFSPPSGNKDIKGMDKIIIAYLRGDDSFRDKIIASGMKGIKEIEEFIASRKDVEKVNVPDILKKLSHKDYAMREAASETLSRLPDSEISTLRTLEKGSKDPEIRLRLREVRHGIEAFSDRKPLLLKLLKEMYNKHAPDVMEERLKMVLKEPNDMRSVYAVDQVSFKTAWKLLESKPEDMKLTYLLLKVYTNNLKEVRRELRKFSAPDILRIAAATWWPVEIDPVKKDGAYGWTTRAQSVDGNIASNVMLLGLILPRPGAAKKKAAWTHLEQKSEITYIFSYPRHSSKDVVAVFRLYQMPPQVLAWMNGYRELPKPREVHCTTFRGTPSTARLPMAHITGKESRDWSSRKYYEWAKPLFPENLRKEIEFIKNKYEKPKIDMPE